MPLNQPVSSALKNSNLQARQEVLNSGARKSFWQGYSIVQRDAAASPMLSRMFAWEHSASVWAFFLFYPG